MAISRKKILFLLFFLSGIFVLPTATLALDWPPSPAGTHLTSVSTLPALIQYIYEWGIALGGLAAFIALVIAGLQYLASMGDPTMMKDAIGRIRSAGLGIVLLLASWLILNTINPDLTSFQSEAPNFGIPPADEDTENFDKFGSNPCKYVILDTSLGPITIYYNEQKEVKTISANDIRASIGYIDKKNASGETVERSDDKCSGNIWFWAKKDCDEDMLGVFGSYNRSIMIERKESIKCIEFKSEYAATTNE